MSKRKFPDPPPEPLLLLLLESAPKPKLRYLLLRGSSSVSPSTAPAGLSFPGRRVEILF
jgi:hypothetical protein